LPHTAMPFTDTHMPLPETFTTSPTTHTHAQDVGSPVRPPGLNCASRLSHPTLPTHLGPLHTTTQAVTFPGHPIPHTPLLTAVYTPPHTPPHPTPFSAQAFSQAPTPLPPTHMPHTFTYLHFWFSRRILTLATTHLPTFPPQNLLPTYHRPPVFPPLTVPHTTPTSHPHLPCPGTMGHGLPSHTLPLPHTHTHTRPHTLHTGTTQDHPFPHMPPITHFTLQHLRTPGLQHPSSRLPTPFCICGLCLLNSYSPAFGATTAIGVSLPATRDTPCPTHACCTWFWTVYTQGSFEPYTHNPPPPGVGQVAHLVHFCLLSPAFTRAPSPPHLPPLPTGALPTHTTPMPQTAPPHRYHTHPHTHTPTHPPPPPPPPFFFFFFFFFFF